MKVTLLGLVTIAAVAGCNLGDSKHYIPNSSSTGSSTTDSAEIIATSNQDTPPVTKPWNYADTLDAQYINPGKTTADQLVDYAETLKGIPYLYGSVDPSKGFDCSGFITYVFNHFGIAVPRSSEGFTSVEREINIKQAQRGDIILFTGTDSTKRVVGHMGIITSNNGTEHQFIHSTSGKAYGVTTTPLNKYYQGRFVKTIRIFSR